jgi:uncharacterized damage-inducible protein DinB
MVVPPPTETAMSNDEIQVFLTLWESESGLTARLLKTIPADQYDFRPDPEGRSMGELAWHLVEIETIMSTVAVDKKFDPSIPQRPRPRTIPEVAAGFEIAHREAVERVRRIRPEHLDQEFMFAMNRPITVRNLLWFPLLHHSIHHRGQLMMMIRQARGVPSRVYGPNREDTPARPQASTAG